MKWIYRFFTIVMLGGALAIPFFIQNKNGEPMLSIPKSTDLLPGKTDLNTDALPSIPGSTTVYKWQDEQGIWHYGDAPPLNIKDVSTLEVNSNTNLVQGIKTEEMPNKVSELPPKPEQTIDPKNDILSLDRALNILNEAHAVKDMMEARNDQLNAITGDTQNK